MITGQRGWFGVPPSSRKRNMPRLVWRSRAASWSAESRCPPVKRSVDFFRSSSNTSFQQLARRRLRRAAFPVLFQRPRQCICSADAAALLGADRSARRDRQNHVFNRSTRGPVGAFAEMSGQALPHNPSSFFALPPASAATVAALKSSTAAM